MRFSAILAIAITVAGAATARTVDIGAGVQIPVCVEPGNESVWTNIQQAQWIASRMFVPAGITLEWRKLSECPDDGIKISFSSATKETDHPGALAYALPYEGTHIVLFLDRISVAGKKQLSSLLAHVMVHEITHIVEGIPHHSTAGIMKAVFDWDDVRRMSYEPLVFAPEDLNLIQEGLRLRRARLAQRRLDLPGANSLTESAPREVSQLLPN